MTWCIGGSYLQCDIQQIDAIKNNFTSSPISEKLKSLLIAGSVKGGKM
jgi:hypothetical protein